MQIAGDVDESYSSVSELNPLLRGFDSSVIFILRGGIPRPGFLGKFESSNISRDNVSREIGLSLFVLIVEQYISMCVLLCVVITCA